MVTQIPLVSGLFGFGLGSVRTEVRIVGDTR